MSQRQPTTLPSLPDTSSTAILTAETSGFGQSRLNVPNGHLPRRLSATASVIEGALPTRSTRTLRSSIRQGCEESSPDG